METNEAASDTVLHKPVGDITEGCFFVLQSFNYRDSVVSLVNNHKSWGENLRALGTMTFFFLIEGVLHVL